MEELTKQEVDNKIYSFRKVLRTAQNKKTKVKKNEKYQKLLDLGKGINEISKNTKEWEALLYHEGPTIYVIKCDKYYKIGKTYGSISKRLKDLQTGNPFELQIIFALKTKNIDILEKLIHKLFENKRKSGEWFELVDEDFWELERFTKLVFEINEKVK